MYISELRISNFRCFDGTEHIIRFNKGLSVSSHGSQEAKSKGRLENAILSVSDVTMWHLQDLEDYYVLQFLLILFLQKQWIPCKNMDGK